MNCSVLLPVYNAGPFLRTAIESILAQDEPDFEFIIIDDCSSDGSPEIIRQYAAADRRVRPIFHSTNAGLAETLNEGLRTATSDLVVRMDQDDESLPSRLRIQVQFMHGQPDIAVAGSYVYHMGRTPAYDRLVQLPTGHRDIASALRKANCIYHPSVILRRDQVMNIGGYRAIFKNAEDYDLWLRVCAVYRLANIPIPLLRYRFSTSGMTLGKKWQQLFYVQMALASALDPAKQADELASAAAKGLEEIDKRHFLQQVAQGTVDELNRLGLRGDAWRVFRLFANQFKPVDAIRVFIGLIRSGSD